MKKTIIFLILSFFLFICTSCSTKPSEYKIQIDSTDSSEKNASHYNVDQNYNLDYKYIKDKSICESNSDITKVNSEYAELWYTLGETYYSLIMSEDLKSNDSKKEEDVTSIYDNWKLCASQQIADEKARLETIYNGGTIVPVKLSYYEYNLYRSHTLELYNKCIELNIDCETP